MSVNPGSNIGLPIKLLKHSLRNRFDSIEVGEQLRMEFNKDRLFFEGMRHHRCECGQRLPISFHSYG
jgi:hypothetical protein